MKWNKTAVKVESAMWSGKKTAGVFSPIQDSPFLDAVKPMIELDANQSDLLPLTAKAAKQAGAMKELG